MITREIGAYTVDMHQGDRPPGVVNDTGIQGSDVLWIRIRNAHATTAWLSRGDRDPVRMWKALETLHLDAVPVGFLPVGEML